MLNDSPARQQALNVSQSFLIQAPAGSGKTELLIQRYLKLLSETVNNPEEIIAITFTRKAASEMRARVIASLEFVLANKTPTSEHEQQTWNLAKQVVLKDEKLSWQIVQNPSRLRILTIDSFSARLTRQMPVLSQFGAQPEIEDAIEILFQKASEAVLTNLEKDHPWNTALEIILSYIDNDANKVQRLFVSMLHNRDQWLPYILEKNPRKNLENALGHIIEAHLEKFSTHLQKSDGTSLLNLLNFIGKNIFKIEPEHPLCAYKDQQNFFPADKNYLKEWQAIAMLVLTESSSWRSRFTKKEGFPPASDANNSEEKREFQQAKDTMLQLIEVWSNNTSSLDLFKTLRLLPEPVYSEAQWQVLNALVELLPVLVAELYVLFRQTGTVDYTEIALRALQALGQPENPTDLALALDYKIKHILVDEFQDTSVNQFRLLELLTMGWENNDGRTLFLVGDPMQSIYRFRKAEVGLFIKARDYGINQIKLNFLQLTVNFRSTNTLVTWNNKIYQTIFPEKDDLAMSAVRFSASEAFRDFSGVTQVKLHPFFNTAEENTSTEAIAVIEAIKHIYQTKPDAKLAILVLARTHLIAILEELKKNNLAYRAIELEKLFHNQVIQDLLSITKALLNLADSIAWYAILRAPWCGLNLVDLLVLKQHCNTGILLDTLENHQALPLSEAGKIQLQKITPILKHAWLCLHDFELSYVVESVWLALGGPVCISDQDHINVKRFFDCLERFENEYDVSDISILESKLQKLTAESPTPTGNFIEVMTIHKSKGLEFDVVLIPSLDKATKGDDHQLLVWQEIPSAKNKTELVLAPIKSAKKDSIYDYIRYLEKEKSSHELNRLLYVATTRAKHELHLFFTLEIDEKNHDKIKDPKSGSLLSQLWPAICDDIKIDHDKPKVVSTTSENLETNLNHRISATWQHPFSLSTDAAVFKNLNSTAINRRYANWQFEAEKQFGIVFHKVIETISNFGLTAWQAIAVEKKTIFLQKIIAQFNLPTEFAESLLNTTQQAIDTMLNDTFGHWILSQQGFVEYEIYYQEEKLAKKYIIDKLFIADGVLWIVDFKTAVPKGIDVDTFLISQKKHYKDQLMQYKLALTHKFDMPIKAGLYFPLLAKWVEYE